MHLVVGLGNPGREYEKTRHNIGFEVIAELARRHGIEVRRRTLRSVLGDGRIAGERVLLARPMTYMNLSGEAVGAIARMYKIEPARILVIADDTALPLGRIRVRARGSSGGHNGLASVERHLGTQEYPRIRIGVGTPAPGNAVDYVLGRFASADLSAAEEAVRLAADAAERVLADGVEVAMNAFNRPPAAKTEETQA